MPTIVRSCFLKLVSLSVSGIVQCSMSEQDIDDLVIRYPSMFEVMDDLRGMAESNCAWNRRLRIPRDTLYAAAAIYERECCAGMLG